LIKNSFAEELVEHYVALRKKLFDLATSASGQDSGDAPATATDSTSLDQTSKQPVLESMPKSEKVPL
jgi:hypothetical protein